jgi:hypothetical protein
MAASNKLSLQYHGVREIKMAAQKFGRKPKIATLEGYESV